MEFGKPRELNLTQLEEELSRVVRAKEITEKFLNSMNSLSDQKVTEIQNLKANLDLLKDFEKKESKEKLMDDLNKRGENLNKAINHMKKTGEKTYDPRRVEWDSN